MTVVVTHLSVLLAALGSALVEPDEAQFWMDPGAVGTTVMVAVSVVPAARVPDVHTTVPPDTEQLLLVLLTVTFAGRVSVDTTPVAAAGPSLATVRV